MFPGLRLAYLIVPTAIAASIAEFRGLIDGQPSSVLQAGMAEFIGSGAFARHLRQMRKLYVARKKALEAAIAEFASGKLIPLSSEAGLHLCCRLPDATDDVVLATALRECGIGATPLSVYHLDPAGRVPGLVIGFGNTNARRYPGLIQRIASRL